MGKISSFVRRAALKKEKNENHVRNWILLFWCSWNNFTFYFTCRTPWLLEKSWTGIAGVKLNIPSHWIKAFLVFLFLLQSHGSASNYCLWNQILKVTYSFIWLLEMITKYLLYLPVMQNAELLHSAWSDNDNSLDTCYQTATRCQGPSITCNLGCV